MSSVFSVFIVRVRVRIGVFRTLAVSITLTVPNPFYKTEKVAPPCVLN